MLEKKNQVERKVNKESVRVVFVHEENDSLKKKMVRPCPVNQVGEKKNLNIHKKSFSLHSLISKA